MSLMSIENFARHVGQKIGISRWFVLDQSRIDRFADVTEDHQFIHVDPILAAETPFGTTIAHGFLTLSMLSAMSYDSIPRIEGVTMGVNYGFNRIRFVTPVTSGARVRAHFTLASSNADKPSEVTNVFDVSIEIEGNERPALVAEWISRQYF
jgi:acyl dehydratase